MKSVSTTLIIAFLFFAGTPQVKAQKKLDQQTVADLQTTPKYGFILTTERHFKGVLGMYDLLIENGLEIEEYEIVVKGMVVKALTKGSELEAFFEKYKGKIKVSVCSVAMEKLGVEAETLLDGLDITPTASVRMLQLQALGYNTLTY
ncbi:MULTISPECIES: DsrE family protein [Maribacter]|uniref:DsrE family protein n=1 Tax=Maribacter flavus TaxID=1658664 RepID=A0ABU7IHU0_9FLAO|nr:MULTISPECIES: DsrE family protein [Maribacter]MDC6405020.1 DsrE family protein [Maribacter sp. PR66]MEE1972434.1 DsrE family protein [Maribacter flavus]